MFRVELGSAPDPLRVGPPVPPAALAVSPVPAVLTDLAKDFRAKFDRLVQFVMVRNILFLDYGFEF
jgi:hypothetical protein